MYYLFCLVDSGGMRIDRSLHVYFAKDDEEAIKKAVNFEKICEEAGFCFKRVLIDRLGERVLEEDDGVFKLMHY